MNPFVRDTTATKSLGPSLILVLVTLFWGLSFTLMKDWLNQPPACPGGTSVSALTLILLRMCGSLLVITIVRPGMYWRPSRAAHWAGFKIGLAFFIGFALQAIGLAWTTPSRSAFITCFSSALVPVGMWLCFRSRITTPMLIGLALGVVGTAILSFGSGKVGEAGGSRLNTGDLLTLIAALFFAVQVIALDRLGKGMPGNHFTVSYFATCAIGSLLFIICKLEMSGESVSSWLRWVAAMFDRPYMPLKFGVLTVFGTALAFGLMNAYQPKVSASQAALIYLLESVFSSVIAVVVGFDQLTWALAAGGGMILVGIVIVELPNWLKERRLADPNSRGEVPKP